MAEAVLRAVVAEARLLLVRRHSWIFATAQFFFVGGGTRDYLIVYQYAGNNRPGGWRCRPFAHPGPSAFDLRKAKDAQEQERLLLTADPPSLWELLGLFPEGQNLSVADLQKMVGPE